MKDIRTYTKQQLLEFTPEVLSGFNGEIPITTPRIKSLQNNPNISETDILLIAYYKNDILAAYFGILPDIANTGEKFYWNTGWRANNNIDKRAASIVFYKALKLYGSKMVLNHLTPHTKQHIDATNIFNEVKVINGTKFFIKSILSEIIVAKKPKTKVLKPLFNLADTFINFSISLKKTNNSKSNTKITVQNSIDAESEVLINSIKNEFVNDTVKNINHSLKYKWLITDNSLKLENEKYFFSLQTTVFKTYILKIELNNKIIGILHIVNRDNNFKLYHSYILNEYAENIANELYIFLQKNNAKTFLCFDINLNSFLSNKRFLYKKDTIQYFTSAKNAVENCNNNFQAGFGDVLYT